MVTGNSLIDGPGPAADDRDEGTNKVFRVVYQGVYNGKPMSAAMTIWGPEDEDHARELAPSKAPSKLTHINILEVREMTDDEIREEMDGHADYQDPMTGEWVRV